MHLPGWSFGFTGALHPNVLVYLRVRWYDPSSGTAGSFYVLNTRYPPPLLFCEKEE